MKFKLDPSVVCVAVVIGCLIYSLFQQDGLTILKDLMIAAVAGYFGFLRGQDSPR